MKKVSLLGASGMAEEAVGWILQSNYDIGYLYDSTIQEDGFISRKGKDYIISNKFREKDKYIIGVGYPDTKRKIIDSVKHEIEWEKSIVHPICISGNNVRIRPGGIVGPFVVMTCDIVIDVLATINSHVTISHNCCIGQRFHASSGVTISGDVTIGDGVFLGANSCVKEKVTICDDVIVGAGSVVINDIEVPGIYAGNPVRKL